MNRAAANPIYALGHSTRSFNQLIDLLHAHQIRLLCDIRTIPKSRKNPQFNQAHLAKGLPARKIRYRHLKALGGLRRPTSDSINQAWQNPSFRGYADYMQSDEFKGALDRLIHLSHKQKLAIMCAEGNPYRCHRLLVADALTARHIPVLHISSKKSARLHALSRFAKVKGGQVLYPA